MSDGSTAPKLLGDRYQIDRKLARGGMADIFLASDRVLERPVVIKTLLPQYANDPGFVERFRREAMSAAKLNHPNVVAVYDWGSHDDTYFIVMEYVEGQSLAQILQRTGSLDLDRALEVVSDAAAGLGFAHVNGMVHRDVKPGNIMVTTTGEVKVADFGVARALDGSDGLTQTGNVMGTAAYFSPEQARGEVVDTRSDLYSLGVVLFETVTGQRPFSGTTPVSVAYKHVGEAPPAPSSVNGNLPPAVDAVIDALLAKDPGRRYRDADHLRADLDRVRDGRAPLGPRNGLDSAAGGPSRDTDGGTTRQVTVALGPPESVDPPTRVLPPDAAAAGGGSGEDRDRADHLDARPPGSRAVVLIAMGLVTAAALLLLGAVLASSGGDRRAPAEAEDDGPRGSTTDEPPGLPAASDGEGDAPASPSTEPPDQPAPSTTEANEDATSSTVATSAATSASTASTATSDGQSTSTSTSPPTSPPTSAPTSTAESTSTSTSTTVGDTTSATDGAT